MVSKTKFLFKVGYSQFKVRSRLDQGKVTVRSRDGYGQIKVRSRADQGTWKRNVRQVGYLQKLSRNIRALL